MTLYTQAVYVGSSFEQTYKYTTGTDASSQVPFDLTGWSAVFRLRDENDAVIVEVRSGDSGTKSLALGGTAGTFTVALAASVTSTITARKGTFELEISSGSVANFRVLDGNVNYIQRGRRADDGQLVIVQQTSRSVTLERPWVTSVQYSDRGVPGPRGQIGADGPTVEVNSSRIGALPALTQAFARPVSRSDNGAVVHSRERIPAKSFDYAYADDQSRLQAAINAAAALNCDVQLESRLYTGLSFLDIHGKQGVTIWGSAGTSFSENGTTLRFDTKPTPVTGTSASSVAVSSGKGVSKTFVFNSGSGVVAKQPIKLVATAGATATIYGRVESIVGTTCVVQAWTHTGSGTGTAWTWEHCPQPLIDFRSTKGCGISGVNIRLNAVMMNHVIDTGAHPVTTGDSDGFMCERVIVSQATNGGLSTSDYQSVHFNFNNAISSGAYLCRSFGALLGIFIGNGPFAVHSCIFTDYACQAAETVAIATFFDSCTFEPGYNLSGAQIQDGIFAHDNAAGTLALVGNVFNDYQNTATGRIVYVRTLGMACLTGGNVFSTLASQAPVFMEGTQKGLIDGNEFPPGVDKIVEVGSFGGSMIQLKVGVNTFTGSTPVTGSVNVVDLVQEDGTYTRTDSSGLHAYIRNIGSFFALFSSFGTITPESGVDFTSGVDISFSTTNIYNTAAGNGNIYTVAAIDDGLPIDITTTKQITIRHNNATGSSGGIFRKVFTKTAADVVVAANSSIRLRYRNRLGGFDLENVYP